jgi:hypothetical protein
MGSIENQWLQSFYKLHNAAVQLRNLSNHMC